MLGKFWNWVGTIDLNAMGKRLYTIKCSSALQKSFILASGPYFILGCKDLQFDLMHTLNQEELLWRDKSRFDRISEGDRNTRYFHRSVTIRRASNRILCLRDHIIEPIEIKDHILNFNKTLYMIEQTSCPILLMTSRETQGSFVINHASSYEEICAVIVSMKPMKSPDLDGFHPNFFSESLGDHWKGC